IVPSSKQAFDLEVPAPNSGGFIPVYFSETDRAVPAAEREQRRSACASVPVRRPCASARSREFQTLPQKSRRSKSRPESRTRISLRSIRATLMRRVGEAGANVVLGQLGILAQDVRVRHPGREPAEHIADRNSHVADAGTSAALARLDRDDVLIGHRTLHSKHGSPDEASAKSRKSLSFHSALR